MIRLCPKCKTETERNKRGDCKPCAKAGTAAWNKANPERKKANMAAWYAANPERKKASDAAWYAANPERKKANMAAWYAANPDRAKATSAAWRAANPERVKAANAARYAANPEAGRIYSHTRRARKRANGGVLSKDISERLFKLQKGKCPCCEKPLGKDFHLDHIHPIRLGGANEDWNIQLLRQQCNNQKHAKDPVDFMQSRGFLL
jgi:5-methylcytosine-specific restriction endonuclease McrA